MSASAVAAAADDDDEDAGGSAYNNVVTLAVITSWHSLTIALCHPLWTRNAGPKKPLLFFLLLLLVLLLLVLYGPEILKAFLICSGAQRNFAYTFVLTFPIDQTSQIFHLFSD